MDRTDILRALMPERTKHIEIVKQPEIKGKTVTVPKALKRHLGVTDEPTPDDKAKRKAEREARRKARKKAQSNSQKNSDKSSR